MGTDVPADSSATGVHVLVVVIVALCTIFISACITLGVVLVEPCNHLCGSLTEGNARDHGRHASENGEEEVHDADVPSEWRMHVELIRICIDHSLIHKFPLIGTSPEGENDGPEGPEHEERDSHELPKIHEVAGGGPIGVCRIKTGCLIPTDC